MKGMPSLTNISMKRTRPVGKCATCEPTVTVTVYTRPEEDQASQDSSMDERRAYRLPPLPEELLAADSS